MDCDYHLAHDRNHWAITGGSSGADWSFTVAWMRSDRLRKVLVFGSSWPQVRGVDYEQLIGWWRPHDNRFSSNLRVVAALAKGGYDMRLVPADLDSVWSAQA